MAESEEINISNNSIPDNSDSDLKINMRKQIRSSSSYENLYDKADLSLAFQNDKPTSKELEENAGAPFDTKQQLPPEMCSSFENLYMGSKIPVDISAIENIEQVTESDKSVSINKDNDEQISNEESNIDSKSNPSENKKDTPSSSNQQNQPPRQNSKSKSKSNKKKGIVMFKLTSKCHAERWLEFERSVNQFNFGVIIY